MVDYLPSKTIIIGQYYVEIVSKLRDAIKQKLRGIVIGYLASSRQCASSQVTCCIAICLRLWISSTEPPCVQSRPSSYSDYYMFTNLKSHLRGTWFADNESPKAIVEARFEGKDNSFMKE